MQERIQLYSLNNPNGVKVSIMLEEMGLPYEPHLVDFARETRTPEFLSLNPNGKIPAIIDPKGPGGTADRPVRKRRDPALPRRQDGQVYPRRPAARWETIAWLMWQMGGLGPMFGQLGFFNKFAGKDWEDKRPRDRYVEESKRLLGVLDARLAGGLDHGRRVYDRRHFADLGLGAKPDRILRGARDRRVRRPQNVATWLERGLARPAPRGLEIPKRP